MIWRKRVWHSFLESICCLLGFDYCSDHLQSNLNFSGCIRLHGDAWCCLTRWNCASLCLEQGCGCCCCGRSLQGNGCFFYSACRGSIGCINILGCSVYLLSLMHLGAVTITCSVLKTCRAEKEKYLKTAGMFDQARLFTSLYLKWWEKWSMQAEQIKVLL